MHFKQWQQCLDGTKTQTRRLKKEWEYILLCADGSKAIKSELSRLKWKEGNSYAVQPGRGKKAIGRIRITEIRQERLQDISSSDCLAEGIEVLPNQWGTPWYRGIGGEWKSSREAFAELWNSIYKRVGDRWADNPEVWVLTFEPAG